MKKPDPVFTVLVGVPLGLTGLALGALGAATWYAHRCERRLERSPL